MKTQSELELELYQIAGYLPHGMCYQYPIIPADWDGETKLKTGIDVFDFGFHYSGISDLLYYKPVLRPLSDLYKTITHNGKEIILIVECAKIAFPVCNWKLANKIDAADTVDGNPHQLFMYDYYDGFTFRYRGNISDVRNQYKLFDFLNSTKIDYRGLIPRLAIDCNTLEENPYK